MDGWKSYVLLAGSLLVAGCGKGSTAYWIEQMKAPEAMMRIQAIHILQERKGDGAEVVPALIEVLKDEDAYVRREAARALGSFGAEGRGAVPPLQTALRDREPSVRKAAGIALSRIDPKHAPKTAPAPARGK